MKFKSFATAVCLAGSFMAQSVSADWIDWTNTTTGTMTIGSATVNVTLAGNPMDLVNGDGYYSSYNATTYASLSPSDLIRVDAPSSFTLNFDQTVSDLYMALVSVGRANAPVNYYFGDSFTVLSSGPNQWGYNGYTVSGNTFTGTEYNGVLHFSGDFDSITFNTNPNEYWHGFNFASFATASSVSEPASIALLGLGLIGLAAARRRKV